MLRRPESKALLHAAPVFAACALGLSTAAAPAAEIVSDGVLGNSGEQGDDLVRFAERGAPGMGVACDRFGSLWDRAGKGVLNRYAPDGRLLGRYPIIAHEDRNGDVVTVVGDTLVLRICGRLFRLDVTSPPGTAPQELGIQANISWGSVDGRLACIEGKRRLSLLDPATGVREEAGTLPFDAGTWMDMGPDGAVYVMDGSWQIHKFVDGQEARDGWPKRSPGERPQLLRTDDGAFWFGHGWHGTIKRFDADLEPAPGVVQGGASGSFIGHLAQNSELTNGRGMALVPGAAGGRLYAVSGFGCVMHLLEWRPKSRRMEIVRRIGALPHVRGLGLDGKGRVFCINGSWNWDDRPDTPQRFGTTADVRGQVVMLDGGCIAAPGVQYGNRPRVLHGSLDAEVKISGHEQAELKERSATWQRADTLGSAVYRQDGGLVLLVVTPAGAGQAIVIDSNGRYRGHAGDVALRTGSPVRGWTSLAIRDPGVLLGAADGYVIEMTRAGKDWTETRRWNTFGPGRFGARIYIAADDGRLWVADRERHRVCCLDLTTGDVVAAFGRADEEGTGLDCLSRPQAIAARGRRAVVFDSGNQRLVKLLLR